MLVKKENRSNYVFEGIGLLIVFYYALRVLSLKVINSSTLKLSYFEVAMNNFFDMSQPLKLNYETVSGSLIVTFFIFALIETYKSTNKKNVQNSTYGTAEWGKPSDLNKVKEKNIRDNIILTKTEQISKNSRKSGLNRHVVVIGRPGTGKSRYILMPNILNATGSIVITDPKGELLRNSGYSLKSNGYDIKVLNLTRMMDSNRYNPLKYIKKRVNSDGESVIAEEDVMSLINLIFKNTKSEDIKNTSGDPFWDKAEMLLDQAVFYYVLYNYSEKDHIFERIMEVLRKATPDEDGNCALDPLFEKWKKQDPDNIGVKQYEHFKTARGKMLNTIVMTAVVRLQAFNISEVGKLVSMDELELERLGAKGNKGKIAIFIITNPNDATFNFLANILYSQIFNILDINATNSGGELATNVDLYMDEWKQLGEIPRFKENLAYVRGLNVGITIILQSLDQLKEVYEKDWQTMLDCCDTLILLGSNSQDTLKYFSEIMGDKTWYKKSSSQSFGRGSSSQSWDVVGRKLAFIDEIAMMPKNMCILKISGYRFFYSQLYDLTTHPRYSLLYEPWKKETIANKYNHSDYLKETRRIMERKSHLQNIGIYGDVDEILTKEFDIKEFEKLKLVGDQSTNVNEL